MFVQLLLSFFFLTSFFISSREPNLSLAFTFWCQFNIFNVFKLIEIGWHTCPHNEYHVFDICRYGRSCAAAQWDWVTESFIDRLNYGFWSNLYDDCVLCVCARLRCYLSNQRHSNHVFIKTIHKLIWIRAVSSISFVIHIKTILFEHSNENGTYLLLLFLFLCKITLLSLDANSVFPQISRSHTSFFGYFGMQGKWHAWPYSWLFKQPLDVIRKIWRTLRIGFFSFLCVCKFVLRLKRQ